MFRQIRALSCVGLLAAAALSAKPALAETSAAVGYFVPTADDHKSLGVMATTGLTLPIAPIAPQVTVAVPFSGGRYAVTGEARVGHPSAYVGAGVGFGRFNSRGNAGGIYDAFIGKRIAPFTTIEARYYGFAGNNVGSSGFIGVRVAI